MNGDPELTMNVVQQLRSLLGRASGRRAGGGGEGGAQAGAGAGGITSDLGSSTGRADELRQSAEQPGGAGASGPQGRETGGH